MSAQSAAITSTSSLSFKRGTMKDNHKNDDDSTTNANVGPYPHLWAEDRIIHTSFKGKGQEQLQQRGHGDRNNTTSKLFDHRVQNAFERAHFLKLKLTRKQKIKEITQHNGTIHFRVTGVRTGNENGHDIVDRNIPFSHKCAEALRFLRSLPDAIIYWSFTCRFWKFVIASIALFYSLNLLFTFLIIASVVHKPECVNPNIDDIKFRQAMSDAFHLSWTTFTTVGYGLISPATTGHFDQPRVEHKLVDQTYCAGINLILSFESLTGVLFVGFCSAIIFEKLTSFQSNAQVMFSTIMPVKFGEGFMEDYDDDDDDIEQEREMKKDIDDSIAVTPSIAKEGNEIPKREEEEQMHKKVCLHKERRIPCPVLRFRIANELHSNKRGEIVDAQLNIMATIDAKNSVLGIRSEKVFNDALTLSTGAGLSTTSIFNDSSTTIKGRIHSVSSNIKKKVAKTLPLTRALTTMKRNGSNCGNTDGFDYQNSQKTPTQTRAEKLEAIYQMRKSTLHLVRNPHDLDREERNMVSETATNIDQSQSTISSDEASLFRSALERGQSVYFQQETDVEKPNLVYAQVSVTPDRHPFFRSVWVVSHVLDESSPLLKKKVRKAVTANNGYWPLSLNTKEAVRDSIHFDNLLISFKGESSLSGKEVYHQHVYTMDDMRVGVQFRSLLMQNLDGSIFVNTKDIDETMIQEGGIPLSFPSP